MVFLLVTKEKEKTQELHIGERGQYLDQMIKINITSEGQIDLECTSRCIPEITSFMQCSNQECVTTV